MGSFPRVTTPEQLTSELQHPDDASIRRFALEVFGEDEKARRWMEAPREIFDGKSPDQLMATGDPAQMRRVLRVLIRIDYGVFS